MTSAHSVGKLEGVGEGSIVGDLLGSLVGNLVGDLLGIPVGDLLGDATGAGVGDFEGFAVGRLLGDADGAALGASHTPHNALQFALTSMFAAHLPFVFLLAAHSHDFVFSMPET